MVLETATKNREVNKLPFELPVGRLVDVLRPDGFGEHREYLTASHLRS